MPKEEKKTRMKNMRKIINENNVLSLGGKYSYRTDYSEKGLKFTMTSLS